MGAVIDTYLTDGGRKLPFCPGCGHDALLKSLDKALVKLQLDPSKTVIVTDIGCIGLADRYFTTHGFHGLHGRSITYACGLKLACPELTVVVLIGDGGCGIGGAHLLSVARRNIDITLLVANNFNYGMTGGQSSISTPLNGITSTTPIGNFEAAIDLCGVVIAAGAGWAYRGTTFDKDLPNRITDAILQPGFAMLDVWELCTAFYMPSNELKKKDLVNIMGQNDLKYGLLANKQRPEFGAHYRSVYGAAKRSEKIRSIIEPAFSNNVSRQTGIVIAGSAGQKILSTAGLFARASMRAGLSVTQKDDYPITVMTGHSVSEIIISPERIDYTEIDSPDYFIVVSEDGLDKSRLRIEKLPTTCTLYAEISLELPITQARVVRLPFIATAKRVNRLSIGVIALTALIEDAGLFDTDVFADAINKFQKSSVSEISLKALSAGLELVHDKYEVGHTDPECTK